MKKLNLDSKKWIVPLLIVTDVLLLAGILVSAILSYSRMELITNQLTYLQDTSNIIQSGVGNMQSDMAATLEEESSLIESYFIRVTDADFAAGTYDAEVSMIPKEYTDQTKVSIYFGTQEYPLELTGYSYDGVVTLPLNTSYDGNVTFLFMEGEKKTTEVLRDYVGFQTKMKNVLLLGAIDHEPEYQDGKLYLDGTGNFSLNGGGNYGFQTFELLITADNTVIYNMDLISENTSSEEGGGPAFPFSWDEASTESIGVTADAQKPVEELEGEYALDVEADVAPQAQIRIFLRAESEEGYTFEYEMFHAAAAGTEDSENGFVLEEDSKIPETFVYDKKGGSLRLPQ